MMKIISLILMICIMSNMVVAYFPGETIVLKNEVGRPTIDYVIVGNSTIIPNLNLDINSTHIKITFPYDMEPDNFNIVFVEPIIIVNTITEEVEVEVEVIKELTEYRDREIVKYTDECINSSIANLQTFNTIMDNNINKTEIQNITTNIGKSKIIQQYDMRFVVGIIFILSMIIVISYLIIKQ